VSKLSSKTFSSRRIEQFDLNFFLKVAHLSILMVQRLPYPEIPTLTGSWFWTELETHKNK